MLLIRALGLNTQLPARCISGIRSFSLGGQQLLAIHICSWMCAICWSYVYKSWFSLGEHSTGNHNVCICTSAIPVLFLWRENPKVQQICVEGYIGPASSELNVL